MPRSEWANVHTVLNTRPFVGNLWSSGEKIRRTLCRRHVCLALLRRLGGACGTQASLIQAAQESSGIPTTQRSTPLQKERHHR